MGEPWKRRSSTRAVSRGQTLERLDFILQTMGNRGLSGEGCDSIYRKRSLWSLDRAWVREFSWILIPKHTFFLFFY